MLNFIYRVYGYIFAKTYFLKFNKFLFNLSIRGMGVLNFQNSYISGEKKFIQNYIAELDRGIILDVGANIGNYSKEIRKKNSSVKIYAFEPHPITYEKMEKELEGRSIDIYNVGVGRIKGSMKLYDYADMDGSSHASLYKEVIEEFHKGASVEHEIAVISLDEFIKEKKISNVSLLKIDAEGHEMEVLNGTIKSITKGVVEVIHFEFNEMNIVSGTFFRDFWRLLSNYDIYRMLPDGLISIKNYSPLLCEIYAYQNIVAILKKPSNSGL